MAPLFILVEPPPKIIRKRQGDMQELVEGSVAVNGSVPPSAEISPITSTDDMSDRSEPIMLSPYSNASVSKATKSQSTIVSPTESPPRDSAEVDDVVEERMELSKVCVARSRKRELTRSLTYR